MIKRMTFLLRLCITLQILLAFYPYILNAETLTLNDTSTVFDGSMYGSSNCDGEGGGNCQYFNFGGCDHFIVGKVAVHIATVYRSLMGFDLSGLPDHDGIEIDSAFLTLRMFYAAEPDSTLNLGFQCLKHNVIEGTTCSYGNAADSSFTWKARIFKEDSDTILWQIAGAKGSDDRNDSIYAVSPVIGGTGAYRIDFKGLVEYWMDSSATERWCVLADTTTLGGGKAYAEKYFYSSETSTASNRPKLEIFYHNKPGRWRHHVLSGGLVK